MGFETVKDQDVAVRMLKTVLGREFFYDSTDSRTRSTRGLIFLKKMSLNEFFERSRVLKKSAENL